MKKLSLLVLAIVLLFSFNKVEAKTEAELKEILTQTIKVGKDNYSLSDADKVILERYLDQNEISSSHADIIAEKVNKAIEIIKGQGNVEFKKYPQSVKDALKTLVNDISQSTSVRATLTKDGLTVYNQDNTSVLITKLVKQTGSDTNKTAIIVGLSVLIVAVGTCLVIKQVKAGA